MSSKKIIKETKDRIENEIKHAEKQRDEELEEALERQPRIKDMLFEMVRLLRKQELKIPDELSVWVMNQQKHKDSMKVSNPDDIRVEAVKVKNLEDIEIPKEVTVRGLSRSVDKLEGLIGKQTDILSKLLTEIKNIKDKISE